MARKANLKQIMQNYWFTVTLKQVDENVRQIYMNSEANQGGDLSREPRVRLEFPEAGHVISYRPPHDLSVSFSHICINATSVSFSLSRHLKLLTLYRSKILCL